MDPSYLVSTSHVVTCFRSIVKNRLMVANPNHDTLLFLCGLVHRALDGRECEY